MNSKACIKCGRRHWQNGLLCFDCRDTDARIANSHIINRLADYCDSPKDESERTSTKRSKLMAPDTSSVPTEQ